MSGASAQCKQAMGLELLLKPSGCVKVPAARLTCAGLHQLHSPMSGRMRVRVTADSPREPTEPMVSHLGPARGVRGASLVPSGFSRCVGSRVREAADLKPPATLPRRPWRLKASGGKKGEIP